ncbi:MAG: glycosyltransferase, partial [Pseudolabrys sp.]|nr:glycosyltransferase [Pseudolabrys sp.]
SIELSVIAPCYNEAANISALSERTLTTFDRHGIKGELILVDDASKDDTAEMIRAASNADSRVRLAQHDRNRGLFGGWRTGLRAAKGRYVCLIDADLQNPPEEIARLLRQLKTDTADIVQGVRSSIERVRDVRYYSSRILNFLLNTTFAMSAADNKSGFVLCPREVLDDVLDFRAKYAFPHTFLRVAAERKGYSVEEVETLFDARKAGTSFLPHFAWKASLLSLVDLARGFLDFRLSPAENDIDRFLRRHQPLRQPEPYRGWRKIWLELYFLTMPLHKWMIGRPARRLFYALRQSQFLSREDLDAYRLSKLKRVIRHAYYHVPYYRHAFDDAGVTPEAITRLEDLEQFPLLSKKNVRENLFFDLFADNHKKSEMLKVSTSGSTGEPFVIYADKHQLELRMATTLRAAEWTGWRFGDRQARLWHQTIGMTWSQVIRERIDAWFMRRVFVPAYELRDDNIAGFVEKIKNFNPVLIDGYAESFNFLAHYLRDKGIEGFHPKAIMSSAQIMPDQVRKVIEERFGAAVFDKYGSREFSGIAYEDEGHDGHLVMAESYIVEILKDGKPAKPGEIGEVVITDLNNMHVPLIRYRIGDLAVAVDNTAPGKSGRQFPRIGRIEGRAQAVIVCPNGAWLPGTFFAHYFKDYDHVVRHYQIVQNERGALLIKVVPGAHYSPEVLDQIVNGLHAFTGANMRLETQVVDEIPMVRTGKRTGVISNLGLDFQKLADETKPAERPARQ